MALIDEVREQVASLEANPAVTGTNVRGAGDDVVLEVFLSRDPEGVLFSSHSLSRHVSAFVDPYQWGPMPPEDIPKFVAAIVDGRFELQVVGRLWKRAILRVPIGDRTYAAERSLGAGPETWEARSADGLEE